MGSGVRHLGESTLFFLFQEELRKSGIKEEQIISLNFEGFTNRHLVSTDSLHDFLLSKLISIEKYYIFLEEVKIIEGFERGVDSVHLQKMWICISRSQRIFFSEELVTLLLGRYVQLNMLPLSYKEFVIWNRENVHELPSNEMYNARYSYLLLAN